MTAARTHTTGLAVVGIVVLLSLWESRFCGKKMINIYFFYKAIIEYNFNLYKAIIRFNCCFYKAINVKMR